MVLVSKPMDDIPSCLLLKKTYIKHTNKHIKHTNKHNSLFSILPSGKSLRAIASKTSCFLNSTYCTSEPSSPLTALLPYTNTLWKQAPLMSMYYLYSSYSFHFLLFKIYLFMGYSFYDITVHCTVHVCTCHFNLAFLLYLTSRLRMFVVFFFILF